MKEKRSKILRGGTIDLLGYKTKDPDLLFLIDKRIAKKFRTTWQLEDHIKQCKTTSQKKKHEEVVLKWAKHWFHEGEIDEHVNNFVTRSNNKPGNITGLVKAYKENYPFRVLAHCHRKFVDIH